MVSLPKPYLPVVVSDGLLAFPADVTALMPSKDEIPEEFWDRDNEWVEIVNSWFSRGLPKDVGFWMKEGVDGKTAFRHLQCVIGSYQMKHEYKIAAIAFLLSEWCTEVQNWRVDRQSKDSQ